MIASSIGARSTIPRMPACSALVRDLNRLYVSEPALHRATARRAASSGWSATTSRQFGVRVSALVADQAPVLVVCNMTPVPRHGYRIGVPRPAAGAKYSTAIRLSTAVRMSAMTAASRPSAIAAHGQAQSLELMLPPLATIYLAPRRDT